MRLVIAIFTLALISFFPTLSLAADLSATVTGITDGDTIQVLRSRKEISVRLNGIDCPELGQDFSKRAKKFTSQHTYKKNVKIISKGTDKYGRTIADVVLEDGTLLNEKLVQAGLCWWYRKYAPNNKTLAYLEADAKLANIGVWSLPDPIAPWDFRKGRRLTTRQQIAKAAIPEKAKIIGNRRSKVFHWPGCPSYHKVSVKNRVYFSSSDEAKNAGFRAARNCK